MLWFGRATLSRVSVPFLQPIVQPFPQQEKLAGLSVALTQEPLAETKFVGISKIPTVCHPKQLPTLPMAQDSPIYSLFRLCSYAQTKSACLFRDCRSPPPNANFFSSFRMYRLKYLQNPLLDNACFFFFFFKLKYN